ncbi:MAG: D-alanyl-D-alanine carboxypeptidase [Salaquimonas sp.]|nr:D-alanyl-D-alanine carboxypeptidase [Salaquimonas sp.]
MRASLPRLVRLVCVLMLAIAILPALRSTASAAIDTPYIVIDRNTGAVLAEHRAFDRWYPASLTKLMTFYVTLRAIQNGEIAPGSPVVMSKLATLQPPSKMGWPVGTKLRVDTALQILVVKSPNDLAIAIAEAVAGSVPAFAGRMNAEAARIGLTDSHFSNPNGLFAPDQYMSARDIALLARRIFIDFPQYAAMFAVPAIRIGKDVDYSYNLLLERFPGADGMKTGFVCASGYNFTASATRNNRGLIAVLLGAFSQTERAVETARLLLDGFRENGTTTIDQFRRTGPPVAPVSQRKRICSQRAYHDRYDPGAGAAVINSPLLQPRKVTRQPVAVMLGGVDAPPSDALLTARLVPKNEIPVPAPRPEHMVVDVDGAPMTGPSFVPKTIPVPTPRPRD